MINVPFFENTEDDTHCFQAALKMLLKHYFPDEDYSFNQLDLITNKPKDKWTWPMAGLAYMKQKGLEVIHISTLDYIRLANEGREYLKRYFSPQNYTIQDSNSNLDMAQMDAKKYIHSGVLIQDRKPIYNDISRLIKNGYLLICYVNYKHFIVVYDIDDKCIYFHNPGLPKNLNSQKLTRANFKMIWHNGQVMAFKLI